ncbi:hypothetical protein [Candidatus Marithrix sp. Canyon 246]|uniref:hypothetical protein n=1 Tax=Candidatus Marithrix sp. Canyon 246 TaxID=1827136 RepID=UPI000849FA30|nr:hypothetical protein [Candidatus Marithrix sp. Canyon 246]
MLSESIDVCFQLMAAMSQKIHWLVNEVNRLSLHDAIFRLVTFLLEKKYYLYIEILDVEQLKNII